MKKLKEHTVGQIVAEDYRAAKVFREFGLDFCCGGNKTIWEASTDKDLNPKEVEKALQNISEEDTEHAHYNEWSPDFLIDYIIHNHHIYSREVLPELNFYAKKVLRAHGQDHPELEKVYYELMKLYSKIIEHLDEEEAVIFPYIKKLVEADKHNTIPDTSRFGMVADPIAIMEDDHDEAGETMAKIRELTNDFVLPQDACGTYHVLFKNLQAFELDLHKHVHLENNILFPKALHLERKLNDKAHLNGKRN